MSELFKKLESNDKDIVEDAKKQLREQFKIANDPWLLNGVYDYYLKTNSVRTMDFLVTISEPHHQYLFERLCESLKSNDYKVPALTLLGHVARAQPTWLYTLPDHNLFRDVLKLLKSELDLLPLISALLLIIVLLPILPTKMVLYLQDLFEIFSRLASWNCSPYKFEEDQMIHMQVALYTLFLRLYGMYPCNFLNYLRSHYKEKNNPVFIHTIKPMLSAVKMNPSLVTASRDNETTTERWKKMEVHDVIVECERFSLDMTDRCPHDNCQLTIGFRSRSGTSNSTKEPPYQLQSLKSMTSISASDSSGAYFSPSILLQTPPVPEATVPTAIPQPHIQGVIQNANFPSQEGTSPPEAAIEATPETTPIRDFHLNTARNPPINSNAVRTLTNFKVTGSLHTTPTHSQPSSPMRKDMSSAFHFPEGRSSFNKKDSYSSHKLSKLMQDRMQISTESSSTWESSSRGNLPTPSSPLQIMSNQFYLRPGSQQRIESPLSQEDEEVLSIISHKEPPTPFTRDCDSVLPEFEDANALVDDQDNGSPCTQGGLHIPNSKSMISFALQMNRLRTVSQGKSESERTESPTGSSPGNCGSSPDTTTVRRTNSWPDMKKQSNQTVQAKDNKSGILDETDEDIDQVDDQEIRLKMNGVDNQLRSMITRQTQTESFWPYEFLFLSIFPSLENNDVKPGGVPSPAPLSIMQERYVVPSIYDILDKYIESAVQANEKETVSYLKQQLQLSHQQLLFERHRRETHAYRNRRLLSDAINFRLLEECNLALRDQVEVNQKEIDNLRPQLIKCRTESSDEITTLSKKLAVFENQHKKFQTECKTLKETNASLQSELNVLKSKCTERDGQCQQVEAALFDAIAEANVAKEQAWAGEKGRNELEQVNKELLLLGELNLKYQEKLNNLSALKEWEQETNTLKETYSHEINDVNARLKNTMTLLDAYKARLSEMEGMIEAKENLIAFQKKQLASLAEENNHKIQAVESKYQSQLKINRALEEKLLESRQELCKRAVNSPDTSSCHEVNATTTDRTAGLSAHSSPLSASLASSEGSVAFHEAREGKNLQAAVDQKEGSTSRSRHIEDSPVEASTMDP